MWEWLLVAAITKTPIKSQLDIKLEKWIQQQLNMANLLNKTNEYNTEIKNDRKSYSHLSL